MQATTTAAPPVATTQAPAAPRPRRWMVPLEPVGPQARWLLGVGFFVVFVAVWSAATLGGFVSPTFLASPVTMVKEAWLLFTEPSGVGKRLAADGPDAVWPGVSARQ